MLEKKRKKGDMSRHRVDKEGGFYTPSDALVDAPIIITIIILVVVIIIIIISLLLYFIKAS